MMRPDQIARLEELEEALIDIYLDEADPTMWSAAQTPPEARTKEDRGNRFWEKKNACATVMLATETRKLIANDKQTLGRDPYSDGEMDKRINEAEKRAAQLVDRVSKDTARATFMKKATE